MNIAAGMQAGIKNLLMYTKFIIIRSTEAYQGIHFIDSEDGS